MVWLRQPSGARRAGLRAVRDGAGRDRPEGHPALPPPLAITQKGPEGTLPTTATATATTLFITLLSG